MRFFLFQLPASFCNFRQEGPPFRSVEKRVRLILGQ